MKILAGKHEKDKINVGQLLRRINKHCAVWIIASSWLKNH